MHFVKTVLPSIHWAKFTQQHSLLLFMFDLKRIMKSKGHLLRLESVHLDSDLTFIHTKKKKKEKSVKLSSINQSAAFICIIINATQL